MKKTKRLTFADLVNTSDHEFIDISNEIYRIYHFWGDGDFIRVRVHEPVALAVSGSGHRILTALGTSLFIPMGWLALEWHVEEGTPNFVK